MKATQERIESLKKKIFKGIIIAAPLLPMRGNAQIQHNSDETKEKIELAKKISPEEFALYNDEESFSLKDWHDLNNFFSEEKTKHIKYEVFSSEECDNEECFHIEYDPYTGILIPKESFNVDKVKEDYLKSQKEVYSKPTNIKVLQLDFSKDIHYDGEDIFFKGGKFTPETNEMTLYKYNLDNFQDAVKRVMSITGCSKPRAIRFINRVSKALNDEAVESYKTHELSHRDDFAKNIFVPDLPNEYMIRLWFLTEIKASLAQAGLAFQKYKKDGYVSHFAVKSEVDTLSLRRELPNITGEEQQKAFIISYISNQWLKEYNRKGSPYMEKYTEMLCDENYPGYGFRAAVAPNKQSKEEYLRRAKIMFSDVPYWGDLSKIIDYDFELHDTNCRGFKAPILYDLTVDCQTNKEALSRINQFLNLVEGCDKDGNRTDKEQQEIQLSYNNLISSNNNGCLSAIVKNGKSAVIDK